jgi:hypothetical protein
MVILARFKKMDFDDGSRCIINDDFSVTYINSDETIIISGFPSKAEAQTFCHFADFCQENNVYLLIVKPTFSLSWRTV